MKFGSEHIIEQRFTWLRYLKTNGKAERIIKTVIGFWQGKTRFASSAYRKTKLRWFLNYYNGVRPHKGIDGLEPEEILIEYFYPERP